MPEQSRREIDDAGCEQVGAPRVRIPAVAPHKIDVVGPARGKQPRTKRDVSFVVRDAALHRKKHRCRDPRGRCETEYRHEEAVVVVPCRIAGVRRNERDQRGAGGKRCEFPGFGKKAPVVAASDGERRGASQKQHSGRETGAALCGDVALEECVQGVAGGNVDRLLHHTVRLDADKDFADRQRAFVHTALQGEMWAPESRYFDTRSGRY